MHSYERSAHLYDAFDSKDNVDFFLHYAAQAGEILDIGAGTGRLAIPLAEHGILVVAVEPSPAMRREFQEKLERRPDLCHRIKLVPGDAGSFHLERTFPAAFLSGTFDHFIGRGERLRSLQNIVSHLEPDGTLIFDVHLGLMHASPLSPAGRFRNGHREYRRLVGRQVLPGHRVRVELVFEVYRNEELVEQIKEASIVGITDREEVHRLLEQVDCSIQHEYSGYDFTQYRQGDGLLIVEAVYQPRAAEGESHK